MREQITSPANKRLHLAASLQNASRRRKEGLFVCEGVRLCEMAAMSDWELVYAIYTPELEASGRGEALLQQLEERRCTLERTTAELYRKASATKSPQGILVVARQRECSLGELAVRTGGSAALYAVLDGVQDPGNVGTIIRTADAAGAAGVIMLRGTADVYGDKVVRATMGSLFHLPLVTGVTVSKLADFAAAQGLHIYATALTSAAVTIYEADLRGGQLLVFGSEANGVTPELLALSDPLYIPMYGAAESLNVASAAAITIYEAVRQRRCS